MQLRAPADLTPLLDIVGDSRFVLLGEASHGTSEYYAWRAEITKRLISEMDFNLIAVEGDWPDCYKLNQYIKHAGHADDTAVKILNAFSRWPTWMWANWEIVALSEWLRAHNGKQPQAEMVGFFGLDVYSLWDSLGEVLHYLERANPSALESAKKAFECFEPYEEDVHKYAWANALYQANCEDEIVNMLIELRRSPVDYALDGESKFNAEQNAIVSLGADRYYRTMIRSDSQSWNVRDIHMADTLDRLIQRYGDNSKAVVWAHNTHIGDARATDMAQAGMTNLGQLVRERHASEGVVLVGFGSHSGAVIAAESWGAPMRIMNVPKAAPNTLEGTLHERCPPMEMLITSKLSEDLKRPLGHRAIGVVYHPERDSYGNFVPTYLAQRYDVFLFFDETTALHPLHITETAANEPPETYPFAV